MGKLNLEDGIRHFLDRNLGSYHRYCKMMANRYI